MASNNRMDWVALYDYPARLAQLAPGQCALFVCPPAWNARLGSIFATWVKAHTEWAADYPADTPPNQIFWTAERPGGLMVVRETLPGVPRPPRWPYDFTFKPLPAA